MTFSGAEGREKLCITTGGEEQEQSLSGEESRSVFLTERGAGVWHSQERETEVVWVYMWHSIVVSRRMSDYLSQFKYNYTMYIC